jgi:Undecaprenyl-phosphate galactose phosphotransferase WbaP
MEPEFAISTLALGAEAAPASISVNRPVGTILCLALSDVLSISISLLIGSWLRNALVSNPAAPIPGTIVAALILGLCSLTAAGLYPGVNINPVEELRRCTFAITLAFLALWSGTFLLHDLSQSRLVYVVAYLLSICILPGLRTCTREFFAGRSWWGCSVAILGFGETGKAVLETLTKNPGIGLKPSVVLDDDPRQYADLDSRLMRGPLSRCLEITRERQISYGIICMPSLSKDELLQSIDLHGSCFGHVMVIPNLIGMTSLGINARDVGGIIGIEVPRNLLRPSSRLMKRALDLAMVIASAPFVLLLLATCAVLIKLEGGPVLYANERMGYRGKKFKAWKLRSMVTNGDEVLRRYLARHPEEQLQWDTTQKLQRDPRLTRIGKFIRKTSIDELPQLWNVLVGEMSIVGPRPMLESQTEMYGSQEFELYKQVRPGITGLWQISGRNHLSFAERVKLDKYVIQNWSVWLDLYILARTVTVVLTAKGAY